MITKETERLIDEALEVGTHAGYEAQDTIYRIVSPLNAHFAVIAMAKAFAILMWKAQVLRQEDAKFAAAMDGMTQILIEGERKVGAMK